MFDSTRKERPILFSGGMVKTLIEGEKTQTRRVVKLPSWSTKDWADFDDDEQETPLVICRNTGCCAEIPCPYGKPGDLLWVRETWGTETKLCNVKPSLLPQSTKIFYRTDGEDQYDLDQWRPSIFMPRWASRLTLEITKVRVEQVQEITLADIKAEGINPEAGIDAWRKLWDSINAKRGHMWSANPWVWVLEFASPIQRNDDREVVK